MREKLIYSCSCNECTHKKEGMDRQCVNCTDVSLTIERCVPLMDFLSDDEKEKIKEYNRMVQFEKDNKEKYKKRVIAYSLINGSWQVVTDGPTYKKVESNLRKLIRKKVFSDKQRIYFKSYLENW